MLWIAVIVSFWAVIFNLCVFLQSAISYFRIEYLHKGGTVMIGFEDYGKYSLIALGLMLCFALLIKTLYNTTHIRTETSIYKVANNSVCSYKFGLFVDTISFFYEAEDMAKGKFVYCRRENVTLEYNKGMPLVVVTSKYREGSWIANLMIFSFLDSETSCKVYMPASKIHYLK